MDEQELTTTDVAVQERSLPAVPAEMSIEQLVDHVQKIQQAMKAVMKDGTHYGVIPGTDKPTLYKPGAETLLLLFRLDPQYDVNETWDDGHYTVKARCVLFHAPTGLRVGSGEGLCTTLESRYRYRNADRVCPACGGEFIIKGKAEYGGGWICFKKKGGCGAKYDDNDPVITGQTVGKIENPDIADLWNTVLKMACKRALIAGVLNVTAASDIFTQDMEDFTPAPAATAPAAPATIDTDKLAELIDVLDQNSDEESLWGWEVVLANASRRFGRPLEKLSDLTDDEADLIITGARTWREKNPVTPVSTLDADDIEF